MLAISSVSPSDIGNWPLPVAVPTLDPLGVGAGSERYRATVTVSRVDKMPYAVTATLLVLLVAGCFALVVFAGYEAAMLVAGAM
jgi:hypothetical protein